METDAIKEKLQTIITGFHDLSLAFKDYRYLEESDSVDKAIIINWNHKLFLRIRRYIFRFSVVEVCKIFNPREEYSFDRLINQMKQSGEYNSNIEKLDKQLDAINVNEINEIIEKYKIIRDKFVAHADTDRDRYGETTIMKTEMTQLLDVTKSVIEVLHPIILNKEYEYPIIKEVLDYRLHTKPPEWSL
jgi:hypothetical protein